MYGSEKVKRINTSRRPSVCITFQSKVTKSKPHTQDTRRLNNAGLMLAHRLRRWINIKLELGQRLVFAGIWQINTNLFRVKTKYYRSNV